MSSVNPPHVLAFRCQDKPAIVSSVTTRLAEMGGNIVESAQFLDWDSRAFYMRIAVTMPDGTGPKEIRDGLAATIGQLGLELSHLSAARTPRIVLMVSRFDHALLHLLYQIRTGWLRANVAAIVSNHEDSRTTAELHGVPYHYWPVTKANKSEQEARLLDLVRSTGAELVVLARYMQVLSDELATSLSGRLINIHHSFLPSFKGAKPYHQAFERGVKLIGATAHYVTGDLDEGPIIEQETERVTHALAADDLVAVGRDIESRVLARAVKLHLEGRVMQNGRKTVVFA